ncbi:MULTISPECIES: hypothetical protein [unclassified Anabaena]|uniref:hypothetical protein n=1 Tax=unclassified Anabaena TaxID=2619674 RepID=UPI0039C60205
MLQIIDLENQELFIPVSSKEFTTVSGGQVSSAQVASYAFSAAALTAGIFAGLLAFAVSALTSEVENSNTRK